jgi:hypothetical protein
VPVRRRLQAVVWNMVSERLSWPASPLRRLHSAMVIRPSWSSLSISRKISWIDLAFIASQIKASAAAQATGASQHI